MLELLRTAELEPIGWLAGSSNHAMVVRTVPGDLLAVWKPTAGERPLFDFPIGTLTRREVAAYLVSETIGWGIVPPTLLREGPAGEGMVQRWIDVDPEADVIAMVNGDDLRLRRVAVLDAVLNNTDRKAGHLLPVRGGHVHAVDHGVTFSVVPKLRTVLWAWEGEPFDDEEAAGLARVADALGSARAPGPLATALRELLAAREVEATRRRVADLQAAGVFPSPNPDWPAIPWPPV
ncbi:MAG TPA: SCO1664 family protein [Candidatus Binatia bacterium]|nr:SCO1664 family protein [Candidatus Binatia bacterium]